MTHEPIPDCRECGACCACLVVLDDADVARGIGHIEETFSGSPLRILPQVKRDGINVCVHLAGSLMRHATCTIYANRPTMCAVFERGSPQCLKTVDAVRAAVERG